MKKYIAMFLSLVLAFTLLMPLNVSAKDYSKFVNESAPKTRTYKDVYGKEITLTYTTTSTQSDKIYVHPKKRIDVYGTYDEYVDKNNTKYYYLYNTNKLCLKEQEFDYDFENEKDKTDKISKSEAKEVAYKYLLKEVGKALNDYTLESVVYQEQKGIYLVSYSRKIDKYFTDDSITVFMSHNGNVYAFSALYLERYKTYKKSDIDKKSLKSALESASGVKDILLTLDENTGKLVQLTSKVKKASKPAAPKISFSTKKITPRTKKISGTVSKAVKNKTYILCQKYEKGKVTEFIAGKQVNNGKVTLKVNLKKLKKGDKIRVRMYTLWHKGNGLKMVSKKYGTSKIFTIK